MSDTAYYIAAGRSLAAILAWAKGSKAARRKINAFAKRFGTKRVMMHTNTMTGVAVAAGLIFDAEAPDGWRRKENFYVPDLKTAEGKAIAKEMREMTSPGPGPDAGKLFVFGHKMFSPGLDRVGEQWIISQHAKADAPPEAKPIKASKFWKMKEELEATTK